MTSNQFRILIGCYLACVVLAILGHVFTAEQLPVALRDYVKTADQSTWMASWVGVTYLVAATASTIGLMIFKAWARPSFALLAVFGAMPWDGHTVYPALEYLFINLEFMLAGAIVAAAYWAPVRSRFGNF
ncbi:MAG: hypothetical protein ACKO1K_10565 [Burkholderiales bacterium]